VRKRSLLLAVCGLALALAGCKGAAQAASSKTEAVKAEAAAEVKTTLVRRGSILPRITAAGSLLARRESQIQTPLMSRSGKKDRAIE